jgi:hypothetical protein
MEYELNGLNPWIFFGNLKFYTFDAILDALDL